MKLTVFNSGAITANQYNVDSITFVEFCCIPVNAYNKYNYSLEVT